MAWYQLGDRAVQSRARPSAAGRCRRPDEPAVIIMTGTTGSILEWPAAIRLLSQFVRTYSYECSGFGSSEESPPHTQPDSTKIAKELDILLKIADIIPPYVIACHSYGGITSCEFLHHHQDSLADVAGMVFVNANAEKTPATYPNPNVSAVCGEIDPLRTCLEGTHKLLPKECDCGHNIHIERPDAVAEEVRWVLEQIMCRTQ
ncbi:hypothetical protein OIDMADRAFT_27263 [Oidiodendron maius Zn]|uniref:AB hydrolase-1 domain-containing protein n=1 Tax=Oidiodendron maius (strain Zn) TaxID=913774 RepID=A0A0C3CUU0_OIDMZ|nr:hypothetical protein OIDMADRAFT_27263 [Oidiodendron maius Zn]